MVLKGCVTYVGRSSMKIRVDTYIETLEGDLNRINRAFIDMVAIDNQGNPIEVPDLILETPEQKLEYEAAIRRKEIRKQRLQDGL